MRLTTGLITAIILSLILVGAGLKASTHTEANIPASAVLTYTSKTYSLCHMVKPGDPILDALGNKIMSVQAVVVEPNKTWLMMPTGEITSVDVPGSCRVTITLKREKPRGLIEKFLIGGTYKITSNRWVRKMRVLEVEK